MNITGVKIRKIFTDPDMRVKAIVSIIIDNDFTVHDLKVVQGVERLFVAMPNHRSDDGRFQDIAHPISTAARMQIEDEVLKAYQFELDAAGKEAV
jgi:stage V sporulation protein G